MSMRSLIPFLGQSWSFEIPGPPDLTALPNGWVDPADKEYLSAGGHFIGGPSIVRFATYTDSVWGPCKLKLWQKILKSEYQLDYELIYDPGIWNFSGGFYGNRGTRLFVSSETAGEKGAKDTNMPKHLALFSVVEDVKVTRLSVSLPISTSPFFDVTVKHPLTEPVELMMNITRIQPPIPGSASGNKCVLVKTTHRGKKREFKYELGLKDGLGDGVNFPAVEPLSNKGIAVQPWSVTVTEIGRIDCLD
ncbi:hypothetical protein AMATHDRAFT_48330 [Amanita thiersii Skay4041]|uniref:Uncharacterized protein n=1 Tax=Amanita thiersii Skay4041 TaxID=703135 RepID=A0A2A9NQ79_9AGAR|nr:hypothetical protein AMATHDRAFT_48330 [Amanita thiersii Skay4041]